MQQTEKALNEFGLAMNNLNDVFNDPEMREELRKALRDLPLMMNEARDTLGKANEAFSGMKDFSERAARNMENLENFTKPLGERGPQMVDNIDNSLQNINDLLEQLNTFSEALNNREGTIGRIMFDDQLYQRLDNTLANVEDITAQVKPILGDFRIMSDKLARDPSQILKLRSLMDRRPPGVGNKGTPTTGGYHPHVPDQAIHVEGDAWDPVIVP
jgi:phospholipid/cholesterol/gamma-HCH transport system substrate-binding protein